LEGEPSSCPEYFYLLDVMLLRLSGVVAKTRRYEQAKQGSVMKTRRLIGQHGFSLLEVLIAALVLVVAITGLTLLLSHSQAVVVGQGDTRGAIYLAEQKIERLRGIGYGGAAVANQDNSGCGIAAQNNEPCYSETGLTGGAGDTQTFRRYTCVRWVRDDNPELPADPLEPPNGASGWQCPSCAPGDPTTDPGTCGPFGTSSCCTRNTKRIKVAVIPSLVGDSDTNPIDPNRVTLEALLTPVPKP
jgi:prepilin-type N-terminal cleavage/methylation domain-containing protein